MIRNGCSNQWFYTQQGPAQRLHFSMRSIILMHHKVVVNYPNQILIHFHIEIF